MERYRSSAAIRERVTDTVKHRTTITPKIARDNTDIFIRTRAGDRLDNLAFEFYEDVTLWWVIANANNLGKGTYAVPPGTKLRIPLRVAEMINEFTDYNRSRR
jgi:nucleoid-associated protein YgaU